MKKILLMGCAAFVATSLITGCAVKTGNERLQTMNNQNIDTFIIDGKSTKSDVKAKLGGATNVDFMQNGLEKWQYFHTISVAKPVNYVPIVNWFVKGTDDTRKSLIILFDGDVVKTHTFASEDGETMGGLVR